MSNENQGFFNRVYEVTRLIPSGRATTYGAIASFIGSPQAARMVGWALNSKKYSLNDIPAHRVVNKQGLLTGKKHFGFTGTMQQLLESEGIKVTGNQIENFNKIFWDPASM